MSFENDKYSVDKATYDFFLRQSKAVVSKRVSAIEQVPEKQSPTEDSESGSIGDAIIEHSDDDQDPKEEFLVENQEETQLEI
ncbi:hypothetical protein O181_016270 [Austropuccinia psidii MF-1]|uniref:Uncharacterized protein n=1 Tax=Austropuccinia psidii MF-1 TaxID=1389203 RepID=A0A9Q3C4I8_9BASI|nr:hypothetical protein [Austropuccinia psidii MF-1]